MNYMAGLFNMLSDSSHEIRQQADSALSEFLLEIQSSPVRTLLHFLTWTLFLSCIDMSASCSWLT